MKTLEQKKYPIGNFKKPLEFDQKIKESYISTIQEFPSKIKSEVENLTDAQLDTPYREDGWTIRQVVHHCADSHMNSLIRFKLALTEENPTIKPYEESDWAELADCRNFEIVPSLKILEGVHQRWTALLKSLTEQDFEKTLYHPGMQKTLSLKTNLALYDWHCRHHLAHITELIKEKNW